MQIRLVDPQTVIFLHRLQDVYENLGKKTRKAAVTLDGVALYYDDVPKTVLASYYDNVPEKVRNVMTGKISGGAVKRFLNTDVGNGFSDDQLSLASWIIRQSSSKKPVKYCSLFHEGTLAIEDFADHWSSVIKLSSSTGAELLNLMVKWAEQQAQIVHNLYGQ